MRRPGPPRILDQLAEATELHRRGKLNPAKKLYREFLARQPQHADALELLGLAHAELGELSDAARVLERAEAVNPGSVNVAFNLGQALRKLGRHAEAEARFRRVIATAPELAAAHHQLGMVLLELSRITEAEASYREAVRLAPRMADAHMNLGQVLVMQGKLRAALASLGAAADLEPKSVEALTCIGRTLISLGRFERAIEVLNHAVSIAPKQQQAWSMLGTALRGKGEIAKAVEALERAHDLDPDAADSLFDLIFCKRLAADWRGIDRLERQAARIAAVEHSRTRSLQALFIVDDPAAHQLAARAFVKDNWPMAAIGAPVAAPKPAPRPASADGRIHLAYVSSDFRDHPVGHAIASLLAAHDRKRFAVHAFSTHPSDGAPLLGDVVGAADSVRAIESATAAEVGALAHELGIDIAIDLNGYFAGGRPALFAHRIAPVQVSFLGYPGTLGLASMDYVIADGFVLPPGAEAHFDEQVVRLPGTYLPNSLRREAIAEVPSRASQGLPEGAVVLAAFHGLHKVTRELFGCWMRILGAAPGSVLWLPEVDAAVAARLKAEAEAKGVRGERLIFAPRVAGRPDHLARQALADLFLDCSPYNAHTTTADALYMGVPVVTLPGRAFASRVAGSLLHGLGLPELAAPTLADYEATTVRLAGSRDERQALRARLTAARTSSPVFDMAHFARGMEWAFARMVAAAREGQSPAAFDVPGDFRG